MAQIPESQAQIQTFTHLYNVNGYQACLRHIGKHSNTQGTAERNTPKPEH